jgi:hypothetical protein
MNAPKTQNEARKMRCECNDRNSCSARKENASNKQEREAECARTPDKQQKRSRGYADHLGTHWREWQHGEKKRAPTDARPSRPYLAVARSRRDTSRGQLYCQADLSERVSCSCRVLMIACRPSGLASAADRVPIESDALLHTVRAERVRPSADSEARPLLEWGSIKFP